MSIYRIIAIVFVILTCMWFTYSLCRIAGESDRQIEKMMAKWRKQHPPQPKD